MIKACEAQKLGEHHHQKEVSFCTEQENVPSLFGWTARGSTEFSILLFGLGSFKEGFKEKGEYKVNNKDKPGGEKKN